jgi:hypothetical protein
MIRQPALLREIFAEHRLHCFLVSRDPTTCSFIPEISCHASLYVGDVGCWFWQAMGVPPNVDPYQCSALPAYGDEREGELRLMGYLSVPAVLDCTTIVPVMCG